METYFFEATQADEGGSGNWGKFMVGRFAADEWARRSAMVSAGARPLLTGRGWDKAHILFVDLQTGEGAILRPGGYVKADLAKHAIWVCPMAEPFLVWLYAQDLSDLAALPALVELPDAPFAMSGYRRPGLGRRSRGVLRDDGLRHQVATCGCDECKRDRESEDE